MALKQSKVWLVLLGGLALIGVWAWRRSNERSIPVVRTARVERQDLHTGVITNGRAEPVEFRELRTEITGTLSRLYIRAGEAVKAGARIAEIAQPELASSVAQATAELAAAVEARRLIEQGGTPAQLAEMQAQINAARRERDVADALVRQSQRLAEKGAIARVELEQASQRLARAQQDLALLEEKWNKRIDPETVKHSETRVQAARAALELANRRKGDAVVTAPIDGVVYSLPLRVGDRVEPGAIIARLGDIGTMRVRVFVDEPDLGRISRGQPAEYQWDGLPGRQWTGAVEQIALQVEKREARTGGEIIATLENPAGDLLPSTNLTVEIITEQKMAILTVPREALRIADDSRTVFVLVGDRIASRPVQTGLMNPTRAEITGGLSEGDEVVLLTEQALRDQQRVRRSTP